MNNTLKELFFVLMIEFRQKPVQIAIDKRLDLSEDGLNESVVDDSRPVVGNGEQTPDQKTRFQ